MTPWQTFYAPVMWTLGFWEWGAAYTIVKNRHIGLDVGTNRRAIDVPALWGGTVIIVTKTRTMGWVVVLDTGLPGNRRYHAYCHLSAVNLPRPRTWIGRGERVAKLAAGPKGIAYSRDEFPGTAWGGIHLHLAMSDIAHGAYTLKTGASFGNPETFIREQLAGGSPAGGGATPFPEKPLEWDEMATQAEVEAAGYNGAKRALAEARGSRLDTFSLVELTDGRVMVVSLVTGRFAHVKHEDHVALLRRVAVNNGGDTMLEAELRTVQGYLADINGGKLTAFTLVPTTDGRVHVVSLTTGRRMHVISPSHLDLLRRVASNDVTDTMLTSQIDLVQGYLTAISTPVDVQVDLDKLAERLAEIGQGVSEADVKRAVSDALRETIPQIKVTI